MRTRVCWIGKTAVNGKNPLDSEVRLQLHHEKADEFYQFLRRTAFAVARTPHEIGIQRQVA